MDASTTQPTDVLHFENHSKLSAEEIAKAVARHNHHHPAQGQNASTTPKAGSKRR